MADTCRTECLVESIRLQDLAQFPLLVLSHYNRAVTRSRRHLLIALLLPLLALRALLPAGYMAEAQAGEFRLVMCAEGLHLPQDSDDQDPAGDNGLCLFAHAAQAAVPAAPFIVPAAPEVAPAAPGGEHLLAPTTGPPRADLARGPPSLS